MRLSILSKARWIVGFELFLTCLAPTLRADTLGWTNLMGGKFSEAKNWQNSGNPTNPKAPGACDEALFDIGSAPFTVDVSEAITATATVRDNSSPILVLSGGGYTVFRLA